MAGYCESGKEAVSRCLRRSPRSRHRRKLYIPSFIESVRPNDTAQQRFGRRPALLDCPQQGVFKPRHEGADRGAWTSLAWDRGSGKNEGRTGSSGTVVTRPARSARAVELRRGLSSCLSVFDPMGNIGRIPEESLCEPEKHFGCY